MFDWHSFYIPLMTFAFASSITPGPNNIMLTASGANYGFFRTLPHIAGVASGFFILLLAVAFGLGNAFSTWPILQSILKYVGSAYLLFLAWKIAHAGRPEQRDGPSKPFTLWQAALFQVVNVKAWIMAIGSMSAFTLAGTEYAVSALVIAGIFSLINLPCISLWTGFGVAIGRFLQHDRALRTFNFCMAALTAGSVILLYLPESSL